MFFYLQHRKKWAFNPTSFGHKIHKNTKEQKYFYGIITDEIINKPRAPNLPHTHPRFSGHFMHNLDWLDFYKSEPVTEICLILSYFIHLKTKLHSIQIIFNLRIWCRSLHNLSAHIFTCRVLSHVCLGFSGMGNHVIKWNQRHSKEQVLASPKFPPPLLHLLPITPGTSRNSDPCSPDNLLHQSWASKRFGLYYSPDNRWCWNRGRRGHNPARPGTDPEPWKKTSL